jgi:predicted GNAT family acetyltransferase
VTEPVVVHVPELNRWEVRVREQTAGFTEYFMKDDRFVFVHTEIGEEFGGRGLGSILARGALDDVRAMGRVLVPLCPFIRDWMDRHEDYLELADTEMLAGFDAKRARRESQQP